MDCVLSVTLDRMVAIWNCRWLSVLLPVLAAYITIWQHLRVTARLRLKPQCLGKGLHVIPDLYCAQISSLSSLIWHSEDLSLDPLFILFTKILPLATYTMRWIQVWQSLACREFIAKAISIIIRKAVSSMIGLPGLSVDMDLEARTSEIYFSSSI